MNEAIEKRLVLKQRFLELGAKFLLPSAGILVIGLLLSNFFLSGIGLTLLLISGSFAAIFTHIGWSKNKTVDIIFNRVSIFLPTLGFTLGFLHSQFDLFALDIGVILVLVGYSMVFIGNRLSHL